jgi:hypothetical protein
MRADHIALARPLLDYRRWGLCGPVRINAAGTTHFEPGGVSFTILIYVHPVPLRDPPTRKYVNAIFLRDCEAVRRTLGEGLVLVGHGSEALLRHQLI